MKQPTQEQRDLGYTVVGEYTTAEVASMVADLERLAPDLSESAQMFAKSLLHDDAGYYNNGRLSIKQLFFVKSLLLRAVTGTNAVERSPGALSMVPKGVAYLPTDHEKVLALGALKAKIGNHEGAYAFAHEKMTTSKLDEAVVGFYQAFKQAAKAVKVFEKIEVGPSKSFAVVTPIMDMAPSADYWPPVHIASASDKGKPLSGATPYKPGGNKKMVLK